MTEAEIAYRRRWIALALLAVAQFVVVLDSAIVTVALPSIGSALDFSQDDLAWVVNAYVLTFGGFLLLGGRAADLLGRRRVFIAGLVPFALASLAGGLAESDAQLVAARAVQGLGAAILSASAFSIVAATFREGTERNRAMGVWAAVGASGAAAGLLLGGVLTDWLGWEWVFWVNVPIGLAAAALAPVLLAESRADGATRRFDLAGAISVTGGLSVLVYALLEADDAGWASTQTLVLLALAAGMLAGFVAIERRAAAPLVPFRIFRVRAVAGANATMLLVFAAMFAMFMFISLYMQQVLGYEPLTAGLAYLPMPIGIMISSGVASQVVTRVGVRPILVTGLALVAGGLTWFGQVSPGGTFLADILGPSLLVASGAGAVFVSLMIASVSGVSEQESGLASGLINTSQQVGGALGIALLATVANSRTEDLLSAAGGDPAATGAALTEGFQAAFLGGAALALIAALVALVVMPRVRVPSGAAAGGEPEPAPA